MTDNKKYFYTTIADQFDDFANPYDQRRRLEVIFDELLPEDLAGYRLLEVGCGSGKFSQRAFERNMKVTALDVGISLLQKTLTRSPVTPLVGDSLNLPIKHDTFDIILSTEVIEHTTNPVQAIREMARLLKPGGILVLTCPNHLWQWVINLATSLKLRPFEVYENFPRYCGIEKIISDAGLVLEKHFGFHPWPFQISFLWSLSRKIDIRFGKGIWGHLMINQAVRAKKYDTL
jgi:2-polyprenyl-3-methyl-5-hydroxy-6-metoxy-1,4-benzoquinol methylase